MKAVNLLPPKHRPAAPTGGRQGISYVLLGVLGALLVCVVAYVLTVNSINSKKSEVARAQQETSAAEAKMRRLKPYGDFSSVAQTRLSSVKQQARGRIDWERLVRELAHVLPERVWLMNTDAAADPAYLHEGSGNSGDNAGGPLVHLVGCAHNQRDVATTLVRLRRLSGVTDVKLKESIEGEKQESAAGAANTGSASNQDCGQTGGEPNYKFDATVTFDKTAAAGVDAQAGGKVPARLGGGS